LLELRRLFRVGLRGRLPGRLRSSRKRVRGADVRWADE